MGRGLVDPVDDLRATNPPSNPAAAGRAGRRLPRARLRPQAADPRDHDLARLRSVVDARTSATSPTRATTRATIAQRLRAEVLLDAICDVTGVPEEFDGMPAGTRGHRDLDAPRRLAVPRHLRPARPESGSALRAAPRHDDRAGAAPDERAGPAHARSPATTAAAASWRPATSRRKQIVEELYLPVYSRLPSGRRAAGRDRGCSPAKAESPAGDRRSDVGAAEHAGVCVQGLTPGGKLTSETAKWLCITNCARHDPPRLPAARPDAWLAGGSFVDLLRLRVAGGR